MDLCCFFKKYFPASSNTFLGNSPYYKELFNRKNILISFFNLIFGSRKHCRVQGVSMLPTLKDGDLLIWPAWVPHFVEENKSNKQRINIASNIKLIGV